MQTLFDDVDRREILARVAGLEPSSARRWGKMDVAQMLAHCACGLEMATSAEPGTQRLFGKLFGRFARKSALGERPFSRNLPTDSTFVISDRRDLARERARVEALVARFVANGPAEAGRHVHLFFGPLTGEEWGVMQWKHLDHHLRQFGA